MIYFSLTPLITCLIMLGSMAFFTLLERKILSYVQTRKGPNKVSVAGLLQPVSDGVKLFSKESTTLLMSNMMLFNLAAAMSIMLAIVVWAMYPSGQPYLFIWFSMLLFLCLSSLSVYPTMLAGWASNSKYALLGAMRSIAQTISYEITMALILITSLIMLKTLNINYMTMSTMSISLMLPIIFFIWLSTALAETNRSPYDLAEGESELVSGFNVEFSAAEFAFIFMAEYLNIIFISLLTAMIYITNYPHWMMNILLKVAMFTSLTILVRSALPRLRYDRLMALTWTSYLPLTLILMTALISI